MMETAAPEVQAFGGAAQVASEGAGGELGGGAGGATFSSAGPLPPVATGAAGGSPPPSASDQAFGGGGMPSIERTGIDPDDEPAPNGTAGLDRDLQSPRRELAAHGQTMPQQGGAEELKANPGVVQPAPGAAPDAGPPPSPEIAAAVQQAQADSKAGTEEAKSQAEAYQAGMKEQQDRFDDEQRAAMLEQLEVMGPADKRAMLKDLGYPAKDIPKLTEAELDQVIEDKYDANARKTKVLGMTPDELAKLTPAQKAQFLVDIGIDKGDVDRIGQSKAAQAFDQIMQVAHVDGQHKVKIKIKGGFFTSKSWDVTVKCDGGSTDISVQKQGGFLSKLWGWVKLALPIVLTLLAPLTAGVSLIALAVYQAVTAIASGDWLGAVIGVAGALTGAGLFAVAHGLAGAASGFEKLATVANKVKSVATAAQSALKAEKAKNPGSLLGALADGASAFAGFSSSSAGKFAQTMESWAAKLKKWDAIVTGGQTVMTAMKGKDPIAALAAALATAAAVTGPGNAATKDLQKASQIATYVDAGKRALGGKPPDYAAVATAALGIAGQLNTNGRIQDAAKITAKASALEKAIAGKDEAAIAQAALGLAESIEVAKYGNDDPGKGGTPQSSAGDLLRRASEIVSTASTVLLATRAKPRPDYLAAAGAITQLTADLTASQQTEKAARLVGLFDTWTKAVNSKDELALLAASTALGNAINAMRGDLDQQHASAQQAAQKEAGAAAPSPADTAAKLVPDPGPAQAPLASTSLAGIGVLTPALPDPGVDDGMLAPSPGSGRGPTPGANYTVIPGDTLSGIASRFDTTVDSLLALNPQLVGDRIYIDQKLFVPGADKLLTPGVTTDATFQIDPSVVTSQRDQAVRRAQTQIDRWNAQISAWEDTGGLGWDFGVDVTAFRRQVDAFDDHFRQPTETASDIDAQVNALAEQFQRLTYVAGQRSGQNNAALGVAIFAAEVVRDGAGALISALDRTRLLSGAYQGIITAIDEYAKGGSGAAIATRAALAAVIEAVPDGKGLLGNEVNEAFRELANTVNEYMAEVSRDPDMTAEQKRELERKYLAKIPTMFAMGFVKGKLDFAEEEEKASQAKQAMDEMLYEMFQKIADVSIDKAQEAGGHGG